MSCCAALAYFWTGWSCQEITGTNSVELLIDNHNDITGIVSDSVTDGRGTIGISTQDDELAIDDGEMPSTLSKYRKALVKQEKRRKKRGSASATASSSGSSASNEGQRRDTLNASIEETERRLKEFLRGSDNPTTTTDSPSSSSSCESLLNGKRLTTADELIRRFETRIPVNVLVSYFNEYHASLKKKAEEDQVNMSKDVDSLSEKLSNMSLSDEDIAS